MSVVSALGPDLGALGRPPAARPWEEVRIALLDALFAAEAEGDLEHPRWQGAFEGAVRSLRLRLLAEAETQMAQAAEHSHYPQRRLRAELPDGEAADALLNRLLAAGIPLEAFESAPDAPEFRQRRAEALDRAWEELARTANAENARWRARAAAIAAWRRPMAPFWVAATALALVTLVVAAWLGGQLAAPAWFDPIGAWWWSLPWP